MLQRFRTNEYIADRMREMGDLLTQQGANPFRARAYRRAGETIADLDRNVADIVAEAGRAGLTALPNIGTSLAAAIDEMVATGRWAQLERLRGTLAPEKLFQTVPGIGPGLAREIHDHLHVETLEGLEQAAHDGRLETVPGMGARRSATVRATLAQMLQRVRPRPPAPGEELGVETILDVDREYRNKAARDELPKIAPRRFNPSGEAWLPVVALVSGLTDADAIAFSVSDAQQDGLITLDWAAFNAVLGAIANTFMKLMLVYSLGDKGLFRKLLGPVVIIGCAGLGSAFIYYDISAVARVAEAFG